MQLSNGTLLQGGKYRIERVLGQGGFGITYLAEQPMLGRKVAVKEFFMKELCERNDATSFVTLGTESGRDTVNRFRDKFLKEARNIARLNHPHIVRIIDVFEENGTAYYVMEYAENGSLADKVKKEGYLSEPIATQYILQVADALDYVHQRKMNHLDVKPANIMLNDNGDTVLIDFGLSKQYDAVTGNQTSTTPVGISEGYAPMEQYKQGGVVEFSPETDIYALGATFYKLLTGITPPSASDVMEDGLSADILKSKGISDNTIAVICKAMESRKKDRMKSVKDFIGKLNEQTISRNDANILKEETNITEAEKRKKEVNKSDTDDATVSIDSEETTYIKKPSENNEETELVKSVKAPKADVKEDRKQTEDVLKYAEVGVIDNRKQKVLMSVTGIALILFLTFHMSMNLVILFSEEDYNMICEMLSANRYAVVATMVLAVLAVLHILYAFGLAMQNRKARGEERYAVTDKPMKVEWASQNMLVLGLIIFFGLVLHLYDFWYKMMFQELVGGDVTYATDGGYWIRESFSNPIHVVLYLIWFTAIWFYLTHGFWNALHTLGLNGKKWFGRWQWIGIIYVTALMGGFALVAVGYCLQCYK